MKSIFVAVSILVLGLSLSACVSFTYKPQPYKVAAENTEALKKSGAGRFVDVGPFTKTIEINNSCHIVGGVIEKPEYGFEGYIQKALTEELKRADMFNNTTPKITLTGSVEKLSLTTLRMVYTSSWDIGVRLTSSNGKSFYITQHYDFNAGENFLPDCQMMADHYMFAVQKTLGKLINAPEFQSLVTP